MQAVYAKALQKLIDAGHAEAEAVEKLVKHLAERGRVKLLAGIRRELRAVEARKRLTAPLVEAASEGEKHAARQGAKEAGIEATEVVVNPSLIRGWRARKGGTLVDRSGKRALIDLYQKITADN